MILDKNLEFCDATSVAAAAGSALVGNVINLDNAGRRLTSEMLYLCVQVTTAFVGSGATAQFKLMSDDAAAINTTTGTPHFQSKAFGVAELTLGKQFYFELPAGIPAYEQYLGMVVTTAGATTTAGAINAFLTNDVSDWAALPGGNN